MKLEQDCKDLSEKQHEVWKNFKEISLEKNFVVTDEDGYVLAVHPSPPMHDVLMLYYQGKIPDEDILPYKDYGIATRTANVDIPHELIDQVQKLEQPFARPVSNINTSQFDITNPLTQAEWERWYDLVVTTKGHGFLQVLPVGHAANQPFKTNLIQVLPKKESAWKQFQIPIDKMITQREKFYKSEQTRVADEDIQRRREEDKQEEIPKSDIELEAEAEQMRLEAAKNEHIYTYATKNVFKLAEYDFPHLVCMLDGNPKDSRIGSDYMKVCDELQLEKARDIGLTIILHQNWMFVAPLTDPYITMENGLDLFIDPFAYAGIMNIHVKGRYEWPQAAGIDLDENSLFAGTNNTLEPNKPNSPQKYPMSIVIQSFIKSCKNEYIPSEEPQQEAEGDGEDEGSQNNENDGNNEAEGEGNDDE